MFPTLPEQPVFSTLEEEVLAFWQEKKIFAQSVAQNKGKPPYVIYDGPPTANARPPLHTAVPMSFKDATGRYKTMRGYYVPRQVGWDTHGLPVEVQVEKTLGLAGKKEILNLVPGDEAASIAQFNATCRQSVWEFKQEWDKFVPRVGYWTDTEHPYVTYETPYVEGVWRVFQQVWNKGYVFKDYKVLPYCPRCETSLSAAEVAQEYHDTKDVSVYVTFPLVDNPKRAFVAWTTTPWTLPGNVALALGPDIDYVVVQTKAADGAHELILAKERLSILKGDYGIIEEKKGKELLGLTYQPLFPNILADVAGKKFVTVPADFVTTEDGSGIVHTACMYGEEDFVLGQREKLAMEHTVDRSGHFLPRTGELLQGTYVRDALGTILTYLTETHRLYAKETITHSYPFCWRCKTALLYYAKDSWYVAMSRLREELIAANDRVQWIPDHIKKGRFGDFIAEARDWAISRERFWGTPIPVWTSESGKRLCIGSLAELRQYAQDPTLITADFDPHRPNVDAIVLVKDGETYRREPYVLDVWFDSGSMPYASGREALGQFPADFVAEAIDQTRGWFYSLMALGTILKGESPYRTVICMGHLVDEHGKKMSKSVGNVMDPNDTMRQVGADAVRWFIMTVNSPGESKAISIKELQVGARRVLLPVWNILNYFITYANVAGYAPPPDRATALQQASLTELDRWLLSRQAATVTQVTAYLDEYDFMRAGREIEAFVTDLSTWYLRRSRKRTDDAFFTVLYDVLLTLATLLAPLTPFLAETVYRTLRTETMPESVHLLSWPEARTDEQPELEETMAKLRQAVELGLALRVQEKLKVRQPLARAYLTGFTHAPSAELQALLADELNVGEIVLAPPDTHQPTKADNGLVVGLDTTLTDELLLAGQARDFLRQVQNLRKQLGLHPGEVAELLVGPSHRSVVEPLLTAEPQIIQDAFLKITAKTWEELGTEEINLNGSSVPVSLRVPHVESI